MLKNLLAIPCLLLSLVGCTSSGNSGTSHEDVPVEAAKGFDTLEQERDALWREINQFQSRIAPPKGTSKADVEKVFGSPGGVGCGMGGAPWVVYSLGQSGMELDVEFEGARERRWHDNAAARRRGWGADSYLPTDRVESAFVSDPFRQDNELEVPVGIEVSRFRTEVPKLRAALSEYADRLASAPWNRN